MGYHTDFYGHFTLNKALTEAQAKYLHKFADTRRMRRQADVAATISDPIRKAVKLPIGVDGGYFVGAIGDFGQDRDQSIVDYNTPPTGQPSLWCDWVPTEDRKGIIWNDREKFYEYIPWLEYLVEHFLKPWKLKLSGSVEWVGEDREDAGTIVVVNNKVTTQVASFPKANVVDTIDDDDRLVIRDAFLEGRDKDAITMILASLKQKSATPAPRSKNRGSGPY